MEVKARRGYQTRQRNVETVNEIWRFSCEDCDKREMRRQQARLHLMKVHAMKRWVAERWLDDATKLAETMQAFHDKSEKLRRR